MSRCCNAKNLAHRHGGQSAGQMMPAPNRHFETPAVGLNELGRRGLWTSVATRSQSSDRPTQTTLAGWQPAAAAQPLVVARQHGPAVGGQVFAAVRACCWTERFGAAEAAQMGFAQPRDHADLRADQAGQRAISPGRLAATSSTA